MAVDVVTLNVSILFKIRKKVQNKDVKTAEMLNRNKFFRQKPTI